MKNETLVLTASALIGFLSQIEELQGLNLEITEGEGKLDVRVGDSIYTLESPEESAVEVADEVIDVIEDINEDCFDELVEEGIGEEKLEVIEGDVIEGGIIKELVKTLAIGGLVRLTKDAITKA